MSWLDWYNFSSDPFRIRPLQSNDEFNSIFVKTSDVEQELEYMIREIKKSPFLKLISGPRGIGKSTVLQYMVYLSRKNNIFSVYVGLFPHGIKTSKEPTYEIARQLMITLTQQLIQSISIYNEDFFEENKEYLVRISKYIGLEYNEAVGFLPNPIHKSPFETVKDILFGIFDLINRNNLPLLVSIDNLDKLDSNVVIEFLKGAAAQPLMEKMLSSGISILLSISEDFYEKVINIPDLNYLSDRIKLSPLSVSESESLISRRINYYLLDDENVYDSRVVIKVCHDNYGITRNILNDMRNLFIKCYEKNLRYLSIDILEDADYFNRTQIYYQIIKDDVCKIGAEKLLNLLFSLDEKYDDNLSNYIIKLYDKEHIEIPIEVMNSLIDSGIILSDNSIVSDMKLDFNVYRLLQVIGKYNWDKLDFMNWILDRNVVDIIRVQTPGFKSGKIISNLLSYFEKNKISNDIVSIILNNEKIDFTLTDNNKKIINNLRRIEKNYELINNIDLEDADKDKYYRDIFIILTDFLLSFSRFYAYYAKKPLIVYSKKGVVDCWNFIFQTIKIYQKENNYQFNSYRDLNIIYNDTLSIKKGIYNASNADIETASINLENIIIEFYDQMNKFSNFESIKISTSFSILDEIFNKIQLISVSDGFTEDINHKLLDLNEMVLKKSSYIRDNLSKTILVRKKITKYEHGIMKNIFNIYFINDNREEIDKKQILRYTQYGIELQNIINNMDEYSESNNEFNIIIISLVDIPFNAKFFLSQLQKPHNMFIELWSIEEVYKNIKIKDIAIDEKKENKIYDVFICHASEDKQEFVTPLANKLNEKGVKVWYDDFELKLGDNLRRSVDFGLNNSRYGIVVLSKNFFKKEWPQKELDGLVTKEIDNNKVILPIWHKVSKKEVSVYSSILANKLAVKSTQGLEYVVTKIMEVIRDK